MAASARTPEIRYSSSPAAARPFRRRRGPGARSPVQVAAVGQHGGELVADVSAAGPHHPGTGSPDTVVEQRVWHLELEGHGRSDESGY